MDHHGSHVTCIQWSVLHGFFSQEIGSCVLFYGPPGTGKSLAAQAIGFEASFTPADTAMVRRLVVILNMEDMKII